jgi:hypothetical protein
MEATYSSRVQGDTTQMAAVFIVTAVKTSNPIV